MSAGLFSRLRRVLFALVALFVAAFAVATAWSLWSDHRLTLVRAEGDARNLAVALDEHAANIFGETGRTVLGVAESLRLHQGRLDTRAARDELAARLKHLPFLYALVVRGPGGESLVAAGSAAESGEGEAATRADFAFHRDAALARIHILPPEAGPGRPIRVTARLDAPDGTFGGVVEAQVDPDYFNLFYSSIDVGGSGRIFLMRQDGAALVEVPHSGEAEAAIAKAPALRDRMQRTQSGTAIDPDMGIVAYRRLAKLPLVAVVALAPDEITGPWRDRAIKQSAAAVGVLLLVGALSWLLARQLAQLDAQERALQRLVEQRTEQLAQRNAELQEALAALEKVSTTDPLTSLKNRRFLEGQLDTDVSLALRRYKDWLDGTHAATPGADLVFFLIDLDHFKPVNDRYGHGAGDRALVELGRRLQRVFRESDYLVRWGGEEFLAVARGTERAEAEAIAEKVVEEVSNAEFSIGSGISIPITCSIGIACYPFVPRQPGLLSWMQVVEIADRALYLAKEAGRDTWVGLFSTEELSVDELERMLAQREGTQPARGLRVATRARRRQAEGGRPNTRLNAWENAPGDS